MSIRLKDTANITAKSASSATSATKATQDSAGQQINTTYIKGLSVNGRTITYTKGDGSTGTITTQDTNTDTNTTYTLSKDGSTITLTGSDGKTTSVTDSNTTYSTGTTSTAGLTKLYTGTGTATDGTMTQNAINTALNGKANSSHGRHIPDACTTITDWNSATTNGWYMGVNATNAPTSGSNVWYFGEVVAHNTNYVIQTVYQFTASTDAKAIPKYIRAKTNGTWGAWTNVTVAKAVPSNAVFTDTNTWRGVQDNLTSTATDQSLSANQGKVLKGLVDGKANSSHTHNYAGSSSAGGAANSANLLNITGGRVTSANSAVIVGPNTSMMLSTSSMTTGKPASDGYITEYRWDNNGGWSSQLFVPNNPKGVLQYRSMNAGTWNNWNTVYSTCNPQTTITGNAGTATTLQTARTINGTSFNGSANITTANWGTARNIQIGNTAKSVNGSANVTWSLSEIGAAASNHTHSYLPLSGGTMTGGIKFSGGGYNNHAIRMEAGDSNGAFIGIGAGGLTVIGSGESMSVVRDNITNGSDETMIVASDQTIRFLTGVQNGYSSAKEVSINASGVINAPQGMTGNASTATKLQTVRTINGTNFDGSANITTANWGTARTITVGNTGKSVNGSGNVSWSLGEIGAAPAGYGLGTTCQDKSNQDCNNILVTGFYMGLNMTNKPSGCTQGWIYLLVMRHNDSWVRQVAYDFSNVSQVYTRVKRDGSWTAWVATDTNTWRGVQDNLTSTATDQSLSANQGKVLKGLIDGKAASNHTHSYLPLSGGTVTGQTIFNNYLTLNAWSGYGTGTAQMWYDGNAKILNIQNATDLKVGSNTVYHSGNFNPNDKADKSTFYSSWDWNDFNWRISNHHGLASMTVVQGGNSDGLYEWGAGLTFGGTNSTAQFYSPHVGEEMYWRSRWKDAPVRGWHRIWHSGNMAAPHWGTGAPNNSDGRPDGTVYYRYA